MVRARSCCTEILTNSCGAFIAYVDGDLSVVLCHSMAGTPRFAREKDLVDVLHVSTVPVLANNPSSGCSVFKEVAVHTDGLRIPDLLLVYHNRHAAAAATVTYYEAAVLAALYERSPQTAVDLADALFISCSGLMERLATLQRRKLIVRIGDKFSLNQRAFPTGVRVVAIEAKLKQWRRALEQAQTYLVFAHEAYIAMPSSTALRADVVAHCAAAGVGVLAVDADAKVSCALKAPSSPPFSGEYLRLLSATIGLNQHKHV